MRAAVLREVNRPLQVEEVQLDSPGPHEVLLRTGATGVCHSDLHFVDGNYTMAMPAVLGHEAAGTVEAVGDQVREARRQGHLLPVGLLRPLPQVPPGPACPVREGRGSPVAVGPSSP